MGKGFGNIFKYQSLQKPIRGRQPTNWSKKQFMFITPIPFQFIPKLRRYSHVLLHHCSAVTAHLCFSGPIPINSRLWYKPVSIFIINGNSVPIWSFEYTFVIESRIDPWYSRLQCIFDTNLATFQFSFGYWSGIDVNFYHEWLTVVVVRWNERPICPLTYSFIFLSSNLQRNEHSFEHMYTSYI